MDKISEILAILVAGPMVGSEIAVAAFLNPLLGSLPEDSFRAARSGSSKMLGRVMPFWYAATLILLVIAAVLASAGCQTWLVGASAAVMAAVLVLTIAVLVPINNRIAAAASGQEPVDELRRHARRWDRLHWLRVALLVVVVVLLVVGVV